MLLLGMLSLLQICFLPGFLLLQLLRVQEDVIRIVLWAFALSLLINYVLVWLLIWLHSYSMIVLYVIFFSEILLCMRLRHRMTLKQVCMPCIPWRVMVLILTLYYAFYASLHISPSIFAVADAVFRWNTWAHVWSGGHLPIDAWLYPQLLPMNWSIHYVFSNSVLELIPKVMVTFFPLAILLTLYDLSYRCKDFAYTLGAIFFILLCYCVLGRASFYGYADMACACLAFLGCSLCVFKTNAKRLYLGALMVAAAALTKQAGLYVALIYPLFVYIAARQHRENIPVEKTVWRTVGILFLVIAPYYLYALWVFGHHVHDTIIFNALTSNTYYAFSCWKRFSFSYHLLFAVLGGPWVCGALVVVLCVGAWHRAIARVLCFALIVPYFILWALFFGYDLRNIALLIPFVGIALGMGVCVVWDKMRSQKIWRAMVVMILVISVVMLNAIYNRSVLYHHQVVLKMRTGISFIINKKLYTYFMDRKLSPESILTNYNPLNYLPGFKGTGIVINFSNMDEVQAAVQSKHPEYFLIHKFALARRLLDKQGERAEFIWPLRVVDALPQMQLTGKEEAERVHVAEYIQKHILDMSYLQGHYEIIYDAPDVLFLKRVGEHAA